MNAAQPLLKILATYNLHMTLPPVIPTLHANTLKNYTRPDNVFSSESLTGTITHCKVVEHLTLVNMDYFPILIDCMNTPKLINLPPRHNFCMTDWEKFAMKLLLNMQVIP